MSAQTWTSLQQSVAVALTQAQSPYTSLPDNFNLQFPMATSYAENRIYREIPMLASRKADSSLSTTSASRTVSMSGLAQPIVVPEEVNLVTPASTAPGAGQRHRYNRASLDLINSYWPTESTTVAPGVANYIYLWALLDAATIVLAPTPDGTYTTEIVGLFQPTPISAANPTTYLSTTYPELLEAGCLVFLTGALTRNFGAQADETQSAMSWEQQFLKLLEAARDEEIRRRGLRPDVPMVPQPRAAA